jgi:hypothetical protein
VLSAAKAAGDNEIEDRRTAIATTEDRVAVGQNVTGLPTLSEIFGEKNVRALVKWLGLRARAELLIAQAAPASAAAHREEKAGETQADKPAAHTDTDTNAHGYNANGIGLTRTKWVRERGGESAPVTIQLTNFVAEITGDVSRDDGAEQSRLFEVRARLAGEKEWRSGIVSAADFNSLQKWIAEVLGAKAVVFPARNEHARAAIQLLSKEIKTRRVVAHTGWRNDGGPWLYYHVGGAIGADGLVDAEVDLPNALAPFNLPKPPTGDRLREVLRAVALELPKVAPDAITLPLIGAGFVSVLTTPDFSLFLFGYTGSGKSELAALLQAFFGAGFHAKNLPAAWSSSANSLEAIAHTAKDAILVIDDFCPIGAAADQARLHASADRVLRAQGNHSGRGRCWADGTVRPTKPPRGLIVATGEDIPRGQSLRARLATEQVGKDSVNWAGITKAQEAARTGVYAEAMAAFLKWLASEKRIEKLRASATEESGKIRAQWIAKAEEGHKRNATTLAQLQHAWAVWLEFAKECDALDPDECASIREAVEIALDALGSAQNAYQASENPALRFVELIQAALAMISCFVVTLHQPSRGSVLARLAVARSLARVPIVHAIEFARCR